MPSIRILHTADNHLGLQFTSRRYPDELRRRLINERFEALERAVNVANQRQAHLFAVAGDLFDSVAVSKRDIDRAVSILHSFNGSHTIVLPGNHDFYEPGDAKLWGKFRQAYGEGNLVLLDRPEPVRLSVEDRDIVLFPGPCMSKTSAENAIGWIAVAEKNAAALNIGIAHGCVVGISPDADDRYFKMTEEELRAAGVRFWLLGHTHLRFPREPLTRNPQFLIPATHTPDGFDCDHEGFVWSIEVDEDGDIHAESIRTGGFRFHDWSRRLVDPGDLERIAKECSTLDGPRTLMKLALDGRIAEEDFPSIEQLRERLEQSLAYVELDTDGIGVKVDREYVERHFTAGSLPSKLLLALASSGDDLALHLAHELIREAKQ